MEGLLILAIYHLVIPATASSWGEVRGKTEDADLGYQVSLATTSCLLLNLLDHVS